MKRGMVPFLVLNRTISPKSVDLLGWVMAGKRLVFACDCNLIQELWEKTWFSLCNFPFLS